MKLRNWILAALFTALTAVGCLIKIPTPISSFSPLFFFTALSALLLGPKFGALSQGMYVALGLLGLPIFTTGGGIGSIFTTTFGFLLGLIPAAAVIGLLVKRWMVLFLPWDAVKIVAAAGLARRVLPVMGLYESSQATTAKTANMAKNTNSI